MEYINKFHKQWMERTRQSIASWSKQPASPEEVKKQQERLNQQRAIREGKQNLLIITTYGSTYLTSTLPTWIKAARSCFGQEKFETPNIDAIAQKGMRFT